MRDLDYLRQQNQILQSACDERLALIQQLTQIAEERMQVIEVLDAEVTRLKETIAQLKEAAKTSQGI